MKPPLFEYISPETIEGAIAARTSEEDSAILAGGQSLIPTLNFRIANPALIIDIRRIRELRGIKFNENHISVGAMTSQRELELNKEVIKCNPLINEVLQNVAHTVIRNRGTIAGSIAHADAAAELPAMLLATGGSVTAVGKSGARDIKAEDLFKFHLTTSLTSDEIITEVLIPNLPINTGWSFKEFARRHGDYALAGICALISIDHNNTCTYASITGCGIASCAIRLKKAEEALINKPLNDSNIEIAAKAAREEVSTPDETQATTAYRQHLVNTLTSRVLIDAKTKAQERQAR